MDTCYDVLFTRNLEVPRGHNRFQHWQNHHLMITTIQFVQLEYRAHLIYLICLFHIVPSPGNCDNLKTKLENPLHLSLLDASLLSYQLQEFFFSNLDTGITGPRQQLLGQPTGWPRRNSTKSAGFTKDPLSCTRQATALYMPAIWLIIKEAGNL